MNFLQLVQRLRRKCRVSGANPVKLSNQSEEINRLIDWTNEAWMDIQETREDWQWMRTTASFQTVEGQAIYTPAQMGVTDFGNWTKYTWRNYVTAVGLKSEIEMEFRDYESWRNLWAYGANRFAKSRPMEMTITPDKSIGFGPAPIAGYTITGDYFRVPTEMSADADVPSLPERFHMLIVYRAMMYYGASESAAEVYNEGQAEFDRMMRRLQLNQLPDMLNSSALA